MDEPPAVEAFHRAGSEDGPLAPQYEICARSMSKLLPGGGSVLDLGSGSGRYLAYFAKRRPDAELRGVELSKPMVRLGERALAEEGLGSRVGLVEADMTSCLRVVPAQLSLVSCMLALHQLPSQVELLDALRQIATIRETSGCAVWIWDLVRLEDDAVMKEWMEQDPGSDSLFHRDAMASEAAAWTEAELTQALAQAGLDDLHHAISRPPLLQAHWAPARAGGATQEDLWHEIAASGDLRRRVIALRLGFTGLP